MTELCRPIDAFAGLRKTQEKTTEAAAAAAAPSSGQAVEAATAAAPAPAPATYARAKHKKTSGMHDGVADSSGKTPATPAVPATQAAGALLASGELRPGMLCLCLNVRVLVLWADNLHGKDQLDHQCAV